MSLAPCPSCSRHFRAAEACCPFCGASAEGHVVAARSFSGLSRAMILLGGAVAIGSAIEACGGEPMPTAVPVYGAPAPVVDAGSNAPSIAPTTSGSAPVSSSAPAAAPSSTPVGTSAALAPNAGPGSALANMDSASVMAGYGAPPPLPDGTGGRITPPTSKKPPQK